MVGAVVLARLADDPALARAFLDAAAASVLPHERQSSNISLTGIAKRSQADEIARET
jgi:hypothetical protein